MRAVVARLVATVSLLALPAPIAAAPPEDVAAYCRATYPQVQFQVRCLNVEHAAAARVTRASPGADREVFNRCLSGSASWASMEACLGRSVRGGAAGAAPGATVATPAPTVSPEADGPSRARGGPAVGPSPGAVVAPTPRAGGPPPSSTTVLGPQAGGPAAPPERPTRPISEADADRQLRGVLERVGNPAAQCTKKQYGPGWVTICE